MQGRASGCEGHFKLPTDHPVYGRSQVLVAQHQTEVSPVARAAKPLSARLPCGLGLLRLPLPTGLSAGLAASVPVQETKLLRETNGLTTFRVIHRIG